MTKLGPYVFHEVFDKLFAKVFVAFVETILVALEPIVTIGHPHTHTKAGTHTREHIHECVPTHAHTHIHTHTNGVQIKTHLNPKP